MRVRIRSLWEIVPSFSAMALATVYASGAQAQTEGPGEAAEGGLTEIVVTAQKRTEALSRTAAAVSVIGQATLDSVGARSFNEAVTTLPNVSANGLGSTIAIRGLGTNTLGEGNSTVATHIDGIFYSSLEPGAGALYDIARIEVLRGPQGTLYGRNATAGVVNILTNNANTDKIEAFGDVSYGSWNRLTARGVVNLPISEAFAIRLVGGYDKGETWQRLPNGDHPDNADVLNFRLAWRAQPTDRITWDARVTYTDNKLHNVMSTPTHLYDAATGTFRASTNSIELAALPPGTQTDGLAFLGISSLPSSYKGISSVEAGNTRPARTISFRSNLNFELGDQLSLTYLLGYSHTRQTAGILSGLGAYQVNYTFPSVSSFWSHEIDINYQSEQLKAIIGLYSYQTDATTGDQFNRVFLATMDANNRISYSRPLIESSNGGGTSGSTARAIFGQATFDVTDRFRVTGGARYNWDSTHAAPGSITQCPFGSGLNGRQPNVTVLTSGAFAGMRMCDAALLGAFAAFGFPASRFSLNAPSVARTGQSTKFTWKAGVEYDLAPDTMFYATVATGYKAGRAGEASNNAPPIRPETNINYEAGIRSRLFNNTLSLNLTAFWTDYKDQQIVTTIPNQVALTLVNAGRSRTRGIEFEYAWAPTPADRINGYVNYLDAKFIDFLTTDDLTSITKNFAGNRLAGAPEFSTRISYSHIFDLGSAGTITPTASLFYQTKAYVSFTNTLPTLIPAYTRSDLIIRYETANKRFSLEGYINNIEDKQVVAEIFPALSVANAYFSPPRSYGVRLGFRY